MLWIYFPTSKTNVENQVKILMDYYLYNNLLGTMSQVQSLLHKKAMERFGRLYMGIAKIVVNGCN